MKILDFSKITGLGQFNYSQSLPWHGWGANPGAFLFFRLFILTLPLSHKNQIPKLEVI
jgi:hypothetical protein